MAKVHGHALIPVLDGDALDRVPIVAGGVVHEDPDVAQLRLHCADGGPQRVDVADIAPDEARRWPRALEISNQLGAGGLVDVHEAHERLLAHESGHDGRPDTRTAPRDEHDLAFEAWIDGETLGHVARDCHHLRREARSPNRPSLTAFHGRTTLLATVSPFREDRRRRSCGSSPRRSTCPRTSRRTPLCGPRPRSAPSFVAIATRSSGSSACRNRWSSSSTPRASTT